MTNRKIKKYLTIPKNFSADDYYRFKKLNILIQSILAKKNKKNIVFIDVGCGDGQFMKYIKENTPPNIKIDFIGIDKFVTEKSFQFNLMNDDVEFKINLPANSGDIIVCAEIIEHLKNTDNFIKEIDRILKEDGDILLTTPNLASYLNRFLLFFGYQPYHAEVSELESGFGLGIIYKVLGRPNINNKTAGHLRLFTFKALEDFLSYHKIKIIRFYPAYLSRFRPDNKRIGLIKTFFFLDFLISKIFPKLSNGIIVHLRKK